MSGGGQLLRQICAQPAQALRPFLAYAHLGGCTGRHLQPGIDLFNFDVVNFDLVNLNPPKSICLIGPSGAGRGQPNPQSGQRFNRQLLGPRPRIDAGAAHGLRRVAGRDARRAQVIG
jgi:hypothetical protein